MNFGHFELFNGRRIRELTRLHIWCVKSLVVTASERLHGEDVVNTMACLKYMRGVAMCTEVDNGSEFISKAQNKWNYDHGVWSWTIQSRLARRSYSRKLPQQISGGPDDSSLGVRLCRGPHIDVELFTLSNV